MSSEVAAPAGPLAGVHVVVVPSYWPSPENWTAGIFFVDYARALRDAGAKVGVVYPDLIEPRRYLRAPEPPWARLREEIFAGLPVVRIRGPHTSLGRPHLRTRRFAAWLRRGLRHYARRYGSPDVLHAHCALPAGWAACSSREARVVLTEHTGPFSLALRTPRLRALAREAIASAENVVAVSPDLRRQILEAGFVRDIEVIPNPVGAEFSYAPAPASDGRRFRLLFNGRMVDDKGIRELREAAARLEARGDLEIEWHLIGHPSERREFEASFERIVPRERVAWYGLVPREVVARVTREAHLLVLPSYSENCPLSVEEALACGRPVVGTSIPGIEALVGPDDGVLVPARDGAALAGGIARALLERTWDAPAIANRAVERFSGAAIAARYAGMLGGKR